MGEKKYCDKSKADVRVCGQWNDRGNYYDLRNVRFV
jgi:hypothetical protein